MHAPDVATIQALRGDLALQIARWVARRSGTQADIAAELSIPQPTLSKIVNARVSDLSLELLIRIAVRAGLPVVLHTGKHPKEAGAFVSETAAPCSAQTSRLTERARDDLAASAQRLTAEQRLDAQLQHSELLAALHEAGRHHRAGASTRLARRRQ